MVSCVQVCGTDLEFAAPYPVKRAYRAACSLETGRCWVCVALGPQAAPFTIFIGKKDLPVKSNENKFEKLVHRLKYAEY
jgi:hypothetical protein